MRIAFHYLIPRPPQIELDGAVQEAIWLQERFGGTINFLYPLNRFVRGVSPSLSGLRHPAGLRKLDAAVDLHHVFLDRLRALPFTRLLTKPRVATVLTSSDTDRSKPLPSSLSSLRTILVPSESERIRLSGLTKVQVETAPPGLVLSAFDTLSPPPEDPFRLLCASAPWTRRQFNTKGFSHLLDAAERIPNLEIVFLWRGQFARAARNDIRKRSLGDRVEVVDERVDVRKSLETTHASVALAAKPHLLKAYPHSLLEALAASRPVVLSSHLALASEVVKQDCGVAVRDLTSEAVSAAIRHLMDDYEHFRERASRFDMTDFSRAAFLNRYERVYQKALAS